MELDFCLLFLFTATFSDSLLKYDTFSMRMSYEGADAASISRELREFEEKADADYPRFGASGTLKKEAL
ncbi:MAG: hypothetical protein AYP45_00335 [Candidatus Brocadia carolinensis]|uniref:Uncharacterized protein n=1 Tax=Candidatus Brocadia carolinensis TaxID=1004156 RepID=A0A1V4AXX3_9BACT|nr:MAG: hypothetical protein AYP45_00335 [Candidatus Brocadia caroliniensis]